jgi:hypothetical protein
MTLKSLKCGGLNIGGGASAVAEGPIPDGSTNRFGLANCTGSSCTVFPTDQVPAVNSDEPDCTTTGCNFGTPLPIPNQATPVLSTCVLNTWSAPASGSVNLATGAATLNIPLRSEVYLTANVNQPCPVCRSGGVPVSGSPAAPASGTCDRGPRKDQACRTANSNGLTRDCPSGGSDAQNPCEPGGATPCLDGTFIGPISVDLSPLTTATSTSSDAGGIFCPQVGQTALQVGCFGKPDCRSYSETGVLPGPLSTDTAANVTLASTFCIAQTGNPDPSIVDISANLPGPGAVSLPGQFLVRNVAP